MSESKTFGLAQEDAVAEIHRIVDAVKNWKPLFAKHGVDRTGLSAAGG